MPEATAPMLAMFQPLASPSVQPATTPAGDREPPIRGGP